MGKKEKYSFSDVLFSTALIHNPVLIQAVGLGAVVAVATTVKTSLLLAIVFAPVMILTQVIASACLKKVPRWIRVTLYLIIGTAMLVPIIYYIDIYAPNIRLGAGVYLALTALNSITALHCEKVAVKTTVRYAFYDAAASAIGYAAVIILVGFIRELLGMSSIWGIHVNLPVQFNGLLMPFGGFLMIGFLAAILKGFINLKYPDLSGETEIKIKSTSVIVSKKKLNEVEHKTEKPEADNQKPAVLPQTEPNDTHKAQDVQEQEDTSADTQNEEIANQKEEPKQKETIEENTQYDTKTLLKPLDESGENVDERLFSSFGEIRFKDSKKLDMEIDAEFANIISSLDLDYSKEDKEEKK